MTVLIYVLKFNSIRQILISLTLAHNIIFLFEKLFFNIFCKIFLKKIRRICLIEFLFLIYLTFISFENIFMQNNALLFLLLSSSQWNSFVIAFIGVLFQQLRRNHRIIRIFLLLIFWRYQLYLKFWFLLFI